jgi:hypothetical protein
MSKMHCFIHKVLDFQLSPVTFSGRAESASFSGYDFLTLTPFVIIPFLLVLIAGLCLLDQYRRKTTI